MKKAFFGGLLGLVIGGVVMLFFSWVEGILTFRLDPPGIAGLEFTPQAALMLFQCLLTGTIAGGASSLTGRWGLGAAAGMVIGFGLGFFFVRQDDLPWGMMVALAMALPVLFVGVLSSLAAAAARMRQ